MKVSHLIISAFLFIICFFFTSGCGKDSNIYKIKTGYNAHEYIFEPDNHKISFIKDTLPNKTYLRIVDTQTKKMKNYHFADYGFDGPHALFDNSGRVIAGSTHIKGGIFNKKILIIDLRKKKISHDFILPSDCHFVTITKPRWSNNIYALLEIIRYEGVKQYETLLFKTFNPQKFLIFDSETIGSFAVRNIFFLNSSPYLLLDIIEANQPSLLIYDLSNKAIIHKFSTTANLTDIKEAKDGIVYGIVQMPGDNKSKVMEIDIMNRVIKDLVELKGHMETMLVVDNFLFMIGKDLNRANEQNKYWLYPRNLYIINLQTPDIVDIINWTHRMGKLVAYNEHTNEIYYAVTDADRPGLWVIKNDAKTLSKAHHVIK